MSHVLRMLLTALRGSGATAASVTGANCFTLAGLAPPTDAATDLLPALPGRLRTLRVAGSPTATPVTSAILSLRMAVVQKETSVATRTYQCAVSM